MISHGRYLSLPCLRLFQVPGLSICLRLSLLHDTVFLCRQKTNCRLVDARGRGNPNTMSLRRSKEGLPHPPLHHPLINQPRRARRPRQVRPPPRVPKHHSASCCLPFRLLRAPRLRSATSSTSMARCSPRSTSSRPTSPSRTPSQGSSSRSRPNCNSHR